jgi:hypothetical protein
MIRILPFTTKPTPQPTDQQGKFIYDLYRQERTRQGWAEFAWEKLDAQQRLVWARVTVQLVSLGMWEATGVRPPHNVEPM